MHSLTNKQKGNKMAKAKKKAAPKKAVKKAAPKKAAPKKTTAKGPMTKAAIVDHLAAKLDVTKKIANEFLNELNELIYKNAKKSLTLPGLGKFYVQKYKKRNGRNPATGEAMVIPAKTKVRFKVGKALQDAVYPPKKTTAKGPMTKAAIVDHLAAKLEVTKKIANEFLNELNLLIYKNAKKSLTLPGLGKFYVQKYKKRNGRNPATGESMVIPAKTKVRFKVGKALQDAVFPPKK